QRPGTVTGGGVFNAGTSASSWDAVSETHPCRVQGELQAVQRVRWLVADIGAGGRCRLGGIHAGQR
ncbi:hypothetical protein ACLOJK_038902, partial [Asimina triloba]